jgi:hypothetical protein
MSSGNQDSVLGELKFYSRFSAWEVQVLFQIQCLRSSSCTVYRVQCLVSSSYIQDPGPVVFEFYLGFSYW